MLPPLFFCLLDIEICGQLIEVAGVCFEAGDVGLHDHAHAQEGAEDVGVVVQQLLLHLDGDLRTLGRIEGGGRRSS